MERDKILIENYKALLLSDCKKVFPDAKYTQIVIANDEVMILSINEDWVFEEY